MDNENGLHVWLLSFPILNGSKGCHPLRNFSTPPPLAMQEMALESCYKQIQLTGERCGAHHFFVSKG